MIRALAVAGRNTNVAASVSNLLQSLLATRRLPTEPDDFSDLPEDVMSPAYWEEMQKRLPKGMRKEFAPMINQAKQYAEYESRRQEIEAATRTLESHRKKYEKLTRNPKIPHRRHQSPLKRSPMSMSLRLPTRYDLRIGPSCVQQNAVACINVYSCIQSPGPVPNRYSRQWLYLYEFQYLTETWPNSCNLACFMHVLITPKAIPPQAAPGIRVQAVSPVASPATGG